jgi:hypothetical protein
VGPDPDPVRFETLSRIRILKKSFRIRNEFEVKILWKTCKEVIIVLTAFADPGCLSRIQDPTTATKEERGKFVVLPFFVSKKFLLF